MRRLRRLLSTSPSRPRRRAPPARAAKGATAPASTSAGRSCFSSAAPATLGVKAEIAALRVPSAPLSSTRARSASPDRNDVLIPTLAGYDVTIPVVGTDYATGRALVDQVRGGTPVTPAGDGAKHRSAGRRDRERDRGDSGGRADRTVLVGWHLDSVFTGRASTTTVPGSA